MAVTSEFISAISQICAERGIERENVYEALETALLSAYQKEYEKEEADNLYVEIDEGTGKFKILAVKEVVEEVEDPEKEISIDDIDNSVEIGDQVQIELQLNKGFGRIAAQTAKQVVMQLIRESEKEAILDEFKDKVGEIFSALMQRMNRGRVVFEIGKATAYMPPEEQIPNEFYKQGEHYKVLLKEIEDTDKGGHLIVSRASDEFLIKLFELEVPEIESGVIEIKECIREVGSRSKIAVLSNQEGVDPIGSCVGQKGVRISNIMSELGEEKIDIIEWDEDIETFIANSLSPANVISVEIVDSGSAYEEEARDAEYDDFRKAIVMVDEDQLSLAIGKDGQNVRLAHKLVGMKIDIQAIESENESDDQPGDASDDVSDDVNDDEDKKSNGKVEDEKVDESMKDEKSKDQEEDKEGETETKVSESDGEKEDDEKEEDKKSEEDEKSED